MSEVMGVNIVDIVVVVLILLLSIKGLISGFTKELFSAIGLIGGLFAATYFNTQVAQMIHDQVAGAVSMDLLKLIATVVIFVAVWYIANLIGKGLALLGDSEFLSTTSRLGGMLIKMLALFFIFSLITFALSTKPQVAERFKDTLEKSKLYPLLRDTGAYILHMSDLKKAELTMSDANSTTTPAQEQNTTEANSSN